jgi:hypothetical protein
MIIQIGGNISLEVYFDPAERELGFEDDIRFRIYESGPEDLRIFAADETSFLLTCEQTERQTAKTSPTPCSLDFRAQIGEGPMAGAAAADRAAQVASHRLRHYLKRHPVPKWMHQQWLLSGYHPA